MSNVKKYTDKLNQLKFDNMYIGRQCLWLY